MVVFLRVVWLQVVGEIIIAIQRWGGLDCKTIQPLGTF